MKQARAILWAQWRTLRNFYPRGGVAWTAVIGFVWYGFWLLAAIAAARLAANPSNLSMMKTALPGGLLLIFLYWQVVPLLMAATGASLDLRKLQAYPIPASATVRHRSDAARHRRRRNDAVLTGHGDRHFVESRPCRSGRP